MQPGKSRGGLLMVATATFVIAFMIMRQGDLQTTLPPVAQSLYRTTLAQVNVELTETMDDMSRVVQTDHRVRIVLLITIISLVMYVGFSRL
jgi:hypothetical protein